MEKHHIFDLDDTLVRYGRYGPVVPRQTFHALRALHLAGHDCVIVSYNPGARLLALMTGLTKYIMCTVVADAEDPERADLIARACLKAGWSADTPFWYYDDRADNIANVRARFGSQVRYYHVTADTLFRALQTTV